MIKWIEGRNSTGKTILMKKFLGATFNLRDFAPPEIKKNPPDIENNFPEHLTPSEFIFYYDISMPEHITFVVKNSQIHIFLEKVRGSAVERNRIFRLYEKFLAQHEAMKQRKESIKRLENRIKSKLDHYHTELRQYEATKKELEDNEKCRPEAPFITPLTYNLKTLRNNLLKHKRKLINEKEIFELIKNFSSQKSVWIDGKPSSQFEDFYNLIKLADTLSLEELYISHCGNKMWFQNAFKIPYCVESKHLTLDLNSFKKVYIEVPSMHERITILNG